MKPYLVGALLLIGVVAGSCQASREWRDWERDKAATIASVKAREDSAERLLVVGMRLVETAHHRDSVAQAQSFRAERTYRNALTLRDSLDRSLTGSPDTSIPLQMALGAFDSLRVGYDSLKSAYDLQGQALASLDSAFWVQAKRAELYRESVDSLTSLVGRVPHPKKWVPVVTVGVGAVLNGGVVRTGPTISVGLKIPF